MTKQQILDFIDTQYGGNVDLFYKDYPTPQSFRQGGINNPGFQALPNYVQRKIKSNMQMGGDMYGEEFIDPNEDVFVNPIDGLKKGGININPANKGKFTAKAKRAGMSVQGFANKVLKAKKGKFSASTRRQANFAKNASRWKKQEGGVQDQLMGELQQMIQQGAQAPDIVMFLLQNGVQPEGVVQILSQMGVSPEESQALIQQIAEGAQQQQSSEEEYDDEEYEDDDDDMSPEEMYAKMGGYLPPAFPFQGVINDMYNTEPIKGTPAFYQEGGAKQKGRTQNQPANTTETFTDNKMQQLLSAIQDNSMGAYEEQALEEANQMMARRGLQIMQGTGNSQVLGQPGGGGGKSTQTNSQNDQLTSLQSIMTGYQDLLKSLQGFYDKYPGYGFVPGSNRGLSGNKPGSWQMMNVNPYYSPYEYRYRDNFPRESGQGSGRFSAGSGLGRYNWNRFLKDLAEGYKGATYTDNKGQTYVASLKMSPFRAKTIWTPGSYSGGNSKTNDVNKPQTFPSWMKVSTPFDELEKPPVPVSADNFDNTAMAKFGGSRGKDMYLTDEQIEEYRRGGYTVEYLD